MQTKRVCKLLGDHNKEFCKFVDIYKERISHNVYMSMEAVDVAWKQKKVTCCCDIAAAGFYFGIVG